MTNHNAACTIIFYNDFMLTAADKKIIEGKIYEIIKLQN
jgi:hypothetical protein